MQKIKLNIQKFATSGTVYTNIADDSRFRVDWQTASQDTANNRSTINWQLYAELGHNYYSNAVRVDYVNINGQRVFNGNTWSYLNRGTHQLSSGTLNITHNEDGTKTFNINLSGWVIDGGTITGSQDFTLNTILRYAKTNSVDGENIESTFKVNYTKYLSSWQYKLRISIPNVSELERIDYNTSGQEFTLSQNSIDTLFNYYTTPSPVKVGFAIETWSGNTKLSTGNEVIKECKIINANPIFDNFEFADINPTTLALTGDNSVNVNGYSNIQATISTLNKATAQKGASMSKYQFRVGDNSPIDILYSDSASVSGIINNSPSGVYNVYAIDSRNNSTLVSKLASKEIAYQPISFISSSCTVERTDGGVGEYAKLTLSGNIWNDYFDENQQNANSITNIYYEYKKTSEGETAWQTGPTTITPTISGNSFSFTGQVGSNETDNKFELNVSYDFRIYIEDELSNAIVRLTPMTSAVPNISFADDGVGIMCDFDDTLGGLLQIGGEIIKPVGKLLWSGTFSSGSITVNGISNYNVIIIRNDEGIIMIGSPNWGIGGFTNYGSYARDTRTYRFNYDKNNETLTIDNVNKGCSDGTNVRATTEIYGLF